ncbi:FecR family protein [Draconibacterium sediminis]|uniref:FecR family protein n=1 Tax=Draconibacterium sediminis TaxID=1544798 RepID=UPI0026F28469|nr:FecR family protein [Draconibacterium sediminis]
MNSNKKYIIQSFFSDTNSREELKKLFRWLNSGEGNAELENDLENDWNKFEYTDDLKVDSRKIFNNIEKGIRQRKSAARMRTIKKALPYAAVLIILLGFQFYFNRHKSKPGTDIKNYYTSVITEEGQRSKVILPDSSIVWLNSSTTLSYHENDLEKERRVHLSGEAFFQVSKNAEKPFFVQNEQLVVKVLGTEFDVEAYPETGEINVVLESGSVQLNHAKNTSFNYQLKPGEIAKFDLAQNSLNIADIDVAKFSSWKNGVLIFQNDPMKEVIEKLERWYNVEVEIRDEEVYNSIFTGTITNEGYEQIFRLIDFTCPVNCEIINKTKSDEKPKIIITKET